MLEDVARVEDAPVAVAATVLDVTPAAAAMARLLEHALEVVAAMVLHIALPQPAAVVTCYCSAAPAAGDFFCSLSPHIFSTDIENATSGKWSIIRELEQVREMKHNQGTRASQGNEA